MAARHFSPEHEAAESSVSGITDGCSYGQGMFVPPRFFTKITVLYELGVFFRHSLVVLPTRYALNITLHIIGQDLPRCTARIFSR